MALSVGKLFVLLALTLTLQLQTPPPPDVAALHRSVMERDFSQPYWPDVDATQQLGFLYIEGRHVAKDPIMGCALLKLAHPTAMFRYGEHHLITKRAEQLIDEHCGRLGFAERQDAAELMACQQFGLPQPLFFQLDAGYWIEFGATRVRIQNQERTIERRRAHPLTCQGQFALIRYSRVDPPPDANVLPRHLIESVTWKSYVKDGQSVRRLQWFVEEAKGNNLDVVAIEDLLEEPGAAWPMPALPEALHSLTFRMNRTGRVRYEIRGLFQRRGFLRQ